MRDYAVKKLTYLSTEKYTTFMESDGFKIMDRLTNNKNIKNFFSKS